MHFVNHHQQQQQQHLKVYFIDKKFLILCSRLRIFFCCIETETPDAVQIEQEIEKEGLEVVASTTEPEEEDTTLADIEGNKNFDPPFFLEIFFLDGVEEDVGANNIKLMMDVFVTQLPTCVNREMIDKV